MSVPPFQTLKVRVRRFLELASVDRWLLIQAACTLIAVRLALRFLPLRVTRDVLAQLSKHLRPVGAPPKAQERMIWAVYTAGTLVPGGGNCLVRALTLQTLLTQRGIVSELRIGFARADGETVEGHAWLTYEGRVIMGDIVDLERFESVPARILKVGR